MKKCDFVIVLMLTLFSHNLFSQILEPVTWNTDIVKVNDFEFELIFNASIDAEWHLYSQFTPEGGAQPLEFKYKANNTDYEIIGKTIESPYKIEFNDTFGIDEFYFTNNANFKQRIKVLNAAVESLTVSVSYQVCKDQCVQGDNVFKFKLPINKQLKNAYIEENKKDTLKSNLFILDTNANSREKDIISPNIKSIDKIQTDIDIKSLFVKGWYVGIKSILSFNFLAIIIFFFFLLLQQNLLRNIRIPFFTIFKFAFFLTCFSASILVSIQGISNVNYLPIFLVVDLVFFLYFSFFGVFYLSGANQWIETIFKNTPLLKKENLIIIGFCIISFGLLFISLKYSSELVATNYSGNSRNYNGDFFVVFLGYITAILLTLLIIFFLIIKLLMKARIYSWLIKNRTSLGFLSLILSIKFLGNFSFTYAIQIFDREVILSLLIATNLLWATYLFGKISLQNDTQDKNITISRLLFGIALITFTMYLIPGLWGASVQHASVFLPSK